MQAYLYLNRRAFPQPAGKGEVSKGCRDVHTQPKSGTLCFSITRQVFTVPQPWPLPSCVRDPGHPARSPRRGRMTVAYLPLVSALAIAAPGGRGGHRLPASWAWRATPTSRAWPCSLLALRASPASKGASRISAFPTWPAIRTSDGFS